MSGLKLGKQIWIISEEHKEISNAIIQQMGRGVTCMEGQGMYTKQVKNVLFCVVGKRQVMSVVNIVKKIDRTAFIVVQDAREVVDLRRFERKKNKVYALHKRRNVSLSIYAMVKLSVMVYYTL